MRGNLADLAALPGMPSEPTLRKLIGNDPDFAGIVKRGSNGDAYEIDLAVAARYVLSIEERKREAEKARLADLVQLALDIGLGGNAPSAGFSIADRKALLEEELVAIKLGRERGELVAKASVEAGVGELLVWHQAHALSFSARIAKRVDLNRDQQGEIDRMVRTDLAEFARRLRALGEVKGLGDGDSSDPAPAALDDTSA